MFIYSTATSGPVVTDLYREVAAPEVDCNAFVVLFGAREAGYFREEAAQHSDLLRQNPLHRFVCNILSQDIWQEWQMEERCAQTDSRRYYVIA